MARRDPVKRDTKERIVQAALAVFGQRGYHGASIDDVAAAAGVTKGAVYYYFADKDDLARDLQHRLWEQLAAEALAVFDPEASTVANLSTCFEAFLVTISAMPGARTFLSDAWFTPALDAAGRADQEEMLALVEGLLVEGIERGELRPFDPPALTRILVGALMEATVHVLGGAEIAPTLAVIDHLVAALAVGAPVVEP